jgi:hypothetical protein
MAFQLVDISNVALNVYRTSIASPPQNSKPASTSTAAWISDWMELLLEQIATSRLGPTVTTRWLFLAANMVYNSYAFVTADKTPVDMQYWQSYSKGNPISNTVALQDWLEVACQYFFPILIRDWMHLSLTDEQVNAVTSRHTITTAPNPRNVAALRTLLDNYMTARDADNWKNTFQFNGTLPNGSAVIVADNTIDQNLNSLPQPRKWTPLQIRGVKKNYLTPEWGTANAGVLLPTKFAELLESANALYPSDEQYAEEMKEVAEIAASLTPEQKIVAEYWAGGPGTVTPPGMWMVFLDVVIRSNGLTLLEEIKNYTVVAAGLYQASITAWRLKRDHLQARPIQITRQTEYGQPIEQSWNNKSLGQYWLPYQTLDFVTPPFPDFVSGHSTFSSTCARLFCYLFKSDSVVLANPTITLPILNKFTPILENDTANFSINSVFLMPKCSEVEPDTVPPTGVSLMWPTWSAMAASSGKSRIYGGIHVESSNQAGLYVGRLIGDNIWEMFKSL